MTSAKPPGNEQRILLKTATARDASLTLAVLERAGLEGVVCTSAPQVGAELEHGAGALLIAEEAFADIGIRSAMSWLVNQPAWSDLPVLVLARTGADSIAVGEAMDLPANITVIERPLRVSSLISALRSALRARNRQYQLRGLLAGLEEADQRKTEFLATLAHELRNPLAPLHTTLTLLARADMDPEQAKGYYDMMARQIDHMVRLIDDLMEVSRITRGKVELRLDLIELDRIVRDAIELSQPLLTAARHKLEVDLPEGGWIVNGDSVRLTQVFSNLLNNAAKYTPPGGLVQVSIERHGDKARVRVKDNGMGVPPDMLEAMFGMFVQVTGASRLAQGGLGIGLTLVKSLVDLHGGRVRARSAGLGQGTEVTVELPLVESTGQTSTESAAVSDLGDGGGLVLVVDDNRDAADSLSALLELVGARTFVAYSGEQALALAERHAISTAILDIGMPGMDGFELARRLRLDPRNEGLLLIALTGWGQADDKARIAAAGFEHHFLKPLDFNALMVVLRERRGL